MKNESNLNAKLEELEIDELVPEELTDKSLMPFGKHKDKALGDVPARYLLWLADEWEGTLHADLSAYIEKNRRLLTEMADEQDDDDDFVPGYYDIY